MAISLGSGGSMHAYHQHQDGAHCDKAAKKDANKKKQPKISDMWKPHPAMPATGKPSKPTDLTPQTPPRQQIPVAASHPNPEPSPEPDNSLPQIYMMLAEAGLCPGVKLNYTGSTFRKYPWQLHELENLSFTAEYFAPNGVLYIQSKKCQRMPR
jgi:hypothetical protein